jgi:hypothetical protein
LAGEADVDAALQMRSAEFLGVASVENLCANRLHGEHDIESERLHLTRERFIECRPLLAVEHRVIGEVGRRFRLIGGHHSDEGFLSHGLQRVVEAPLLSQGGHRFLADGLAAERTRAMGGIDEALIRQEEQLGMQRIEEHAAQVGG